MSQANQSKALSPDEAIAIFEDSISYFMPATFEVVETPAPETNVFVEYYEAA